MTKPPVLVRRLFLAAALLVFGCGGWGCTTGVVCKVDAEGCGSPVARVGPGEVGLVASCAARLSAGFSGN